MYNLLYSDEVKSFSLGVQWSNVEECSVTTAGDKNFFSAKTL